MSEVGGNLRAMILAAGYGTRLAPVTDHIPKPLLPVDGVPLLDRIIAGIREAGMDRIGINTHHLGEMVAAHVGRRKDAASITLFPEEEILGTGGALHGARDFLADASHFLLHNGDVLCDADLTALVGEHLSTGALATLLLVDWPMVNSVVLADDGRVVSIAGMPASRAAGRSLTYAGIGVFSKHLLDDIGPGFSSLIDPLVRALEADPASVRGVAPGHVRWSDLGTLARYLGAQSETTEPGKDGDPALTRITGHGSDRKFWRLEGGDWSAVAMVSPPEDPEFGRFLEIAGFLGGLDLGTPGILSKSEKDHTVLMEDLGPESLFTLVQKEGFGSERVRAAYRAAVDRLLDIQGATARALSGCPAAVDRSLDEEALRGETDYFRERFLEGHLGLEPKKLEALADGFQALAAVVSAQRQVLIHRDFQSQNILATAGGIGLVDFQGMRLGPLGYDLASLVFDPYVGMPASFRNELVERFADGAVPGGNRTEIGAMVRAAGLQRIMQALGAYGFLGHVKEKKEFLGHIPLGLEILRVLLKETAAEIPGLTGLSRILADPRPSQSPAE